MTTELRAHLATQPGGTLEAIAEQFNVSVLEVLKNSPDVILTQGENFDTVWDDVTEWGNITFIVNTADIIAEFAGELPTGTHRHGYFNLRGKKGFTGHLKAENCQSIAFVVRSFMGTPTASIIFLNQEGQPMFKIFVGRDSHRQLDSSQMEKFHALGKKLAASVEA